MWILHASDNPPEPVFVMGHGEVMVTVHKTPQPSAQHSSAKPVAAASTLELCGASRKSAPVEDVLQAHDPWKSWNPSGMQPQPTLLPNAADALSQFEQRLEKSIMQKIAQNTPQEMERDDVPDRLLDLENRVLTMATKQQEMEQSMHESSKQHANQITALQTQFTAHSQQIHGKIECLQQNTQALFEAQMSQIRSLLAKRPHSETGEL